MNDKAIIYKYLSQNEHLALATASKNGVPEVATIEYVVDGDDLLVNTKFSSSYHIGGNVSS